VFRVSFIAGFAAAALASTGCRGTWDTLTSRQFRDHPIETTKRMIAPEDPVAVLLADPPRPSYEQADAMHRLKEPVRHGRPQQEQDAVLAVLERAAVSDPSPVLRMEAIGALSRFHDTRAAGVLMAAYQNAHGRRPDEPAPRPVDAEVVPAAGLSAGRAPVRSLTERYPITGPTGFPAEWVTNIRCRAAEALGQTNRPEAAKFLAAVAGGAGADVAMEGGDDRQVRLAALRGLGKCRQPEAVVALAQVLEAEADKKDTAIIGRSHEGLVKLTGKKLPPDPRQWNEVVQAGVVIAPEPTWVENAIEQAMFWTR
jgi:HEAT repeat protein